MQRSNCQQVAVEQYRYAQDNLIALIWLQHPKSSDICM